MCSPLGRKIGIYTNHKIISKQLRERGSLCYTALPVLQMKSLFLVPLKSTAGEDTQVCWVKVNKVEMAESL